MKKKARVPAAKAAKRRKRASASHKALLNPSARVTERSAVKDEAKAEIRRLKNRLAKALARIEELQAAAETDFLLKVPNRRGFERELGRAISYIQRYQASGALIVLDVDRLKPINDNFGHAAGDEVLKSIVAVLSRQIRASDVIGRLGGDEFVALLTDADSAQTQEVTRRLTQLLDARNTEDRRGYQIRYSVGQTSYEPARHLSIAELLAAADAAMYSHKQASKAPGAKRN
jgi:diguanylate cyclase (GGDEF)-like protein